MNENDKKLAYTLYERILAQANTFLTIAKKYEVKVLNGFNPSFAELAEIMQELAITVGQLIDDFDPMTAHQANEYVFYMREVAIAITKEDSIQLDKVLHEFSKKPFVVPS